MVLASSLSLFEGSYHTTNQIMNRRLLLLILSLFLIPGCQDGEFTRLQEKAGVLCKEAVPDSRTGLCRVSLEKSPGKKILVKGELLNPEVRDQIFSNGA